MASGKAVQDHYTLLESPDGLLRAVYSDGPLNLREGEKGVWKYADWLPVSKTSSQVAGTVTYRSESLAAKLGMSNLWITFHGYWPERGGICPTTTFKDMEAVPTIQRLQEHGCDGLVCASAGNTARAFAYFSAEAGFPTMIIVAERHLNRIWVPNGHPKDSIILVGIGGGADYNDAIEVSGEVASVLGWHLEGGARNVARRDGIGSLILDAAFQIGALPMHYFQAVGGGPGPIGVHEMAIRAIDSGLFPAPAPRQHLSQNVEHSPIHNAWQAGRSHLIPEDFPKGDPSVFSDFLVNRAPAYSITGGLYDILSECDGQTWTVTYDEAEAAAELFESTEGIDTLSPGAVALASLQNALATGEVGPDDCTVLNISGGGQQRMLKEVDIDQIKPALIVEKDEAVKAILHLMGIK